MGFWDGCSGVSVSRPLIFQSFSRIRIIQGLRWEARGQTGPLKEARSQPAEKWERCQEGSGTRAQRRMRFEVLIVWYGKRGHSRHKPTEARVPNGEQVRVANTEGAWYGEWERLGLGQVAWCSHTSIQGAWARVHGPRAAWLPLHQLSLHRGLGATFKLFLLLTNLDARAGKGIESMLGALTCPSSPG